MDISFFFIYIILGFRRLSEASSSRLIRWIAVIMNFIRYIQTEKDTCTFVIFGLSAISLCDAVRPRPVWTYFNKYWNPSPTSRWLHRLHFFPLRARYATNRSGIHWNFYNEAILRWYISVRQSNADLKCLSWRTGKHTWFEPRHEKICIRGFRPGKTQTGLRSYRN